MSNVKRTILVVDDSEIARETVRFTLQARGYEVITVDSPFSFGGALSRAQTDLVLVDAHMPALSGDKLVEVAIQNRLCTCPIVFYSERPDAELQALVKSSGASGYIKKSNDPEDLVMAVEDYLAGARSRAAENAKLGRDAAPTSQRFGASSVRPAAIEQSGVTKIEQSGVYPSGGPASTRMRGGQKP